MKTIVLIACAGLLYGCAQKAVYGILADEREQAKISAVKNSNYSAQIDFTIHGKRYTGMCTAQEGWDARYGSNLMVAPGGVVGPTFYNSWGGTRQPTVPFRCYATTPGNAITCWGTSNIHGGGAGQCRDTKDKEYVLMY